MIGLDNPVHLAFLAVVLLLLFGAKRLPEIGRSLGSGLRGFRDSMSAQPSPDGRALPESSSEPPEAST